MRYPTEGLTPQEKRCVGLALGCLRGTGRYPDHEDFRSQVICEVLQSLREAAPSGADPEKVACRAARSAIADYWKYQNRKKRQAEVVPLCLLAEGEEPVQPDFVPALVEWLEAQARIAVICTPLERRCLHHFYLWGYSHQEIAVIEGRARKTISNTISSALKKLRSYR